MIDANKQTGSADCEACPSNPEIYITKREAAKVLRISARTLDSWMERRLVPFYKISRTVRFKLADLIQGLDNWRINGSRQMAGGAS